MLAVPAAIAGCAEIVLCTPAGRDGSIAPEIRYAAALCGVRRVFALGGAQAVAAMAYGTESVPRVDKIFGPGNRYVTRAKQLVGAEGTAIDLPAGPSEVLVLADEGASPDFAAADLLSQAEHGGDSQAVLVCRSVAFARRVNDALRRQTAASPRNAILRESLAQSRIVVFDSQDDMLDFAEAYAPEHLIVSLRDPWPAARRGDEPHAPHGRVRPRVQRREHRQLPAPHHLSGTHARRASRTRPDGRRHGPGRGTGRACRSRPHPAGRRCAMRPLAELVRPNIRTLAPYSTARDEYGGQRIDVWLDANESPYDNGVNRYPDPRQQRLREVLAARKGVATDRIFIGSGSDEAIDLAYRIFCRPGIDNAVSIAPTYGMYRVAAAVNDVELREVPLGDDFSLPVERLLAAADERSKLLWLCSPNNPTGNAFPATEIERLLRRFDGMVVLDEAYVDFADGAGFLPRLDEFPNLIVLQTLSKAWGMAGLRIGLAFAAREVAALFSRVKYPYNIPGPTQRAAEEMLGRDLAPQIAEIRSERRRLASELASCPCIERVYPSQTNFLLVRTPAPDALYDALIEAGIIVRNRSRAAGCEGCLRLTVGTPAENDRLLRTVKTFRP